MRQTIRASQCDYIIQISTMGMLFDRRGDLILHMSFKKHGNLLIISWAKQEKVKKQNGCTYTVLDWTSFQLLLRFCFSSLNVVMPSMCFSSAWRFSLEASTCFSVTISSSNWQKKHNSVRLTYPPRICYRRVWEGARLEMCTQRQRHNVSWSS